MAAVNLIRNARVFFTHNVNSETGKLATDNFSVTNTREIKVLDGLSFSQNSTTESVSINESGTTPVRGTKVFNTALEAVDFSFSTYVSPVLEDGDGTDEASDYVDAEESVLWNAFTSQSAIGTKAGTPLVDVAGWVKTAGLTADRVSIVTFDHSNKNYLQRFALIIIMDDTTYVLENCAMESVTLDFGIDAIATLQWAGKAVSYKALDATVTVGTPNATTNAVAFTGGIEATAVLGKVPTSKCRYLANKLSTVTITEVSNKTGAASAAKSWIVPVTGGSLTINNNITYLTPAAMGVVNKPFTYFTGARTMTGSLTAYLRAGTGYTGELLTNALANAELDDTNQYKVELNIGGTATASTRVDLIMDTAMLSVPTIATEQVVSTTIGFTPQGASSIEDTDEVVIKYYAA